MKSVDHFRWINGLWSYKKIRKKQRQKFKSSPTGIEQLTSDIKITRKENHSLMNLIIIDVCFP